MDKLCHTNSEDDVVCYPHPYEWVMDRRGEIMIFKKRVALPMAMPIATKSYLQISHNRALSHCQATQ